MKKYKTNSDQQTKEIAREISIEYLKRGGILGLVGELGAGKTTFTQGFSEGLGISEKIISPTFVLIRHHKIPNTTRYLHHIDLYRIEKNIDINSLGLADLVADENNIVLIEWAEKIKDQLPQRTKWINIKKNSPTQREILVESEGLVTGENPSYK